MKRILAIFCIILMIFSLAGCSKEASNQNSEDELKEANGDKVQINESGDLILFNDDGSFKTLVEGSEGYQNMQKVTFLKEEKVVVLMATYGSSPLGVYKYKLKDDSFTIVTESVKGYSIVDDTIEVSMSNGSKKYFDLNGYEISQPGMEVSTTPASEYETNKQYSLDFEGKGTLDTFSVKTDEIYFYIIANENIYSTDFGSQLVYYKYKLTQIGDSGRYAITIFQAVPPHGEEVVFYQYTIGSGIEEIGSIYVEGTDLFNSEIKDLTYNSVTINNQEHSFDISVKLSDLIDE